MTAAALAAGVISSQAQGTVYSQNVVGYVNLSLPAGSLTMVANQLDTGSNTLDNVFQGTGLTSQKTTILSWNGSAYNKYTYLNCNDSPSTPGRAGFWWQVTPTTSYEVGATNYLQPGQGVFMQNGTVTTATVPTVGQVVQGTNYYTIGTGLNIYSIPQPLAGISIDSPQVNFPVTSQKTTYLQWTGSAYTKYTYLNCNDSPSTPGMAGFWYQPTPTTYIYEDTNPAVWPSAGGSFFIQNGTPSAATWTNVFEVQ